MRYREEICFHQGKATHSVLQHMSGALTQRGANLVGLGRLELPTSPLSGVRSNQLSYRPVACRCFSLLFQLIKQCV